MGYFDLPTGEIKLKVKDGKKEKFVSVAFTDCIFKGEIEELYERWSKTYKIIEIQFNGRKVTPCKKYHWVLHWKDEIYGTFKTREEAKKAYDERKMKRWDDKSIHCGVIDFVEEK